MKTISPPQITLTFFDRYAGHSWIKSSVLLFALGTEMTATACEPEASCAETATCAPPAGDGGSDKVDADRDQAARDGSEDGNDARDGMVPTDIRVSLDASDDGGRVDAGTPDGGTSDARGDSQDASVDGGSADARTADAPGDVSSERLIDGGSRGDNGIDVATRDVAMADVDAPDVDPPDVAPKDAAEDSSTIDVVIGCSATTCSMGCCSNNACKPYASQTDMSCGTGGTDCAACGSDKTCSTGGTCTTIADDIWAVGATPPPMEPVIIHWTKATGWELQLNPGPDAGLDGGLADVWGTDASNVWAVGWLGTILHYDGVQWTRITSPTTENLSAVWGSSRTDVWAVGYNATYQRGLVIRYDGNNWMDMGSVSAWNNLVFNSIWGTGPRDVWVAASGASGSKIFHFGALGNWTDETPQAGVADALRSIWVTPASGWAVGPGTMVRFDGSNWAALNPLPTTSNLQTVSGISANDVWGIGWYNFDLLTELLHFNGSTWTPVDPATDKPLMRDVFARSAGDVWFVGLNGNILHFDGAQVTPDATVPTQADLRGVWGAR